ncbi:hypothetical protein ACFOOM_01165 [Streptomyces echinoruber]|uniref:Transmembrane protein n=1 Tax=Streptomyces echinoruber TaxID=68898 RepID=A0A918QUJ5_9ACTN|nr:hypothetical protein [Streptomyces echinoruber]GGZ72993.1 hypothetical protein GCM10010389_08000 [Streptomyces echinoruber]
MRLRYSIPLPGPLSVGGSVRLFGGGRRRGGGGGLVAVFKLFWYLLVFEAWLLWWCVKPWYIVGVLAHRKVTGRPTPIWRSRGGWW